MHSMCIKDKIKIEKKMNKRKKMKKVVLKE